MAKQKADVTKGRPVYLFNSGVGETRDYKPKNPGQVITVPGQAFTIPEIIARFERGQGVPVPVNDNYTGESEELTGQDVRTWDISEIYDYAGRLQEKAQAAEILARSKQAKEQDRKLQQSVAEKLRQRMKLEAEAAGQQLPEWVQSALTFKD